MIPSVSSSGSPLSGTRLKTSRSFLRSPSGSFLCRVRANPSDICPPDTLLYSLDSRLAPAGRSSSQTALNDGVPPHSSPGFLYRKPPGQVRRPPLLQKKKAIDMTNECTDSTPILTSQKGPSELHRNPLLPIHLTVRVLDDVVNTLGHVLLLRLREQVFNS